MQIERLFQIVYLLMGRKTMTAKALAERFEVSTRTIYRDVETLNAAGVPIYANKGKGGGIGLLENFVLNKSVLSDLEQNQILTALQSFSAMNPTENPQVFSKLSALFNKNATSWIEADFSDWSGQREDLFPLLKEAILNEKVLTFDYYGRNQIQSRRRILPIQLWFKYRSWYLKGYCLEKNDYRLFKLSRLKHLTITEEQLNNLQLPVQPKWQVSSSGTELLTFGLQIDASQAYRIYDEYDAENIQQLQDGSFLVTVTYPADEWITEMILSYGPHAQVVFPETLKEHILSKLRDALNRYELKTAKPQD